MKRMQLFFLMPVLMAALPAVADERLFLQVPALIDAAAPIPEAVRKECALETLMASEALAAIGKRMGAVQAIEMAEQAGDAPRVELTIMAAFGEGGGGITGPKSMTIRANLKKGGVTLATTLLTRESSRGFMGGMLTGTCSVFNRISAALGKDVALWLSRDATLAAAAAGK